MLRFIPDLFFRLLRCDQFDFHQVPLGLVTDFDQ